ncbi:MAG: pyridoxal 5'-phosphate synthase glutaminase subunit PdxT [Acidobacteriota bacterium]|nr:pyridoxal 5'-phosphate synthase glutaminase subunit PdxT [Acidobacteriota bacterium]
MRVGILALQGDVNEHGAALADLGVAHRPVRRPEDLDDLDGIVLPGGESTAMSVLLESSGLNGPLGKALAEGMPGFGTCAGMILLARVVAGGRPDQRSFGAIDIGVRRNGFGRQLESFETDLHVAVLGEDPLHAVFIRAPVVESVGAGVEVLARAPGTGDGTGDGTPVLCREGGVLVSAFHPELTDDRRLHAYFVSMIEERGH